MNTRTAVISAVAALAVAGALFWAFRPEPVTVDMAEARLGPMQGTVAAEGVTRVREPYLVTAPISGTALRSPVDVGDAVERGETVVAVIRPAEPALLDARARAQAEAAVAEAEAAVQVAQANLARAGTDLDHAESQLVRNRELAARGTIPQRLLEDSLQAVDLRIATLEAARSELSMHQATLARARAQLVGPEGRLANGDIDACCAEIVAPQSGTVLSVVNESARLVQAGEHLLTIGDLADLEIEVDLLSPDAVGLAPGARALIERWGGPYPLEARVRRVDPRGFTRVSALGIEEQRVRVLLDFDAPPGERPGLGDAFRVFARIVVWEEPEVLQVPVSALFRHGEGWAVFRIDNGTATLCEVEIGRRTQTEAGIVAGLAPGDLVVAYPGERVGEGTRVVARVEQ